MKNVLLLRAFLFVAVMALASSCSSGAHSAQGPTYSPSSARGRVARGRTATKPTIILASAPVADCRPGDSTVVCCIKKYPASAMEACGATAEEVASVLRAAKALEKATQSDEDDEEDGTPEWKQNCIDKYNECIDENWIGSCHDCLRYCEGQHAWPKEMCYQRNTKRKRR